jgi:CDP-2,3-bis-(O-geranylgeranyl)-sn-glycerol synthase
MNIILQALYFFLPAYLANMAPVFAKNLPFLNKPLDFGMFWKGKRIFGDHKTIRGMLAGVLLGSFAFWVQQLLYSYPFFQELSVIKYSTTSIALGSLLGFGALTGDAVKSFFKRRMNVQPGKSWIPFDQLDFVVGGLAFSCFMFVPSKGIIITLLLVSPVLHVFVNHMGYWWGIRDVKF